MGVFFKFPTEQEWRDLEQSYPFRTLQVGDNDFQYAADTQNSMLKFSAESEILTWRVHLINRLIQARWSYVFLMFHFNKGIPDDEWFISPGKKGESVEYYPHFEMKDHEVKAQFDYYADVFYYKLFSAWDTLGHLLNMMYELGIPKATFSKAVRKLQPVRPGLYQKLKSIIDSQDFKNMQDFRHGITHNHLPGHIGSSVRRVSENHITFGGGDYTPSAQIQKSVVKSLGLFAETLKAIREQSVLDNQS
jgi:Cthe_2314-like HEPN